MPRNWPAVELPVGAGGAVVRHRRARPTSAEVQGQHCDPDHPRRSRNTYPQQPTFMTGQLIQWHFD